MVRILIIAELKREPETLPSELARAGYGCLLASNDGDALKYLAKETVDLVLIKADSPVTISSLYKKIKNKELPAIAILPRDRIVSVNGHLEMDDFIAEPYLASELLLRVKRLLQKAVKKKDSNRIVSGYLVIDQARYEVTLNGKAVELTYREYELLRFLASNKGVVFNRNTILDKVWGCDYYGGDRTVDVHIKRLRSKIDSPTDSFIETVRNIGYRFRSDPAN